MKSKSESRFILEKINKNKKSRKNIQGKVEITRRKRKKIKCL